MDLGEKVIERLEEFAEQLQRGERIMVTTLEQCGCGEGGEPWENCAGCHGTGFIRTVKNFLPGDET